MSLRWSLRIQARVISALLIREMLTRYGRHNIGFMWLFVEPMLFTGGVTILWTLTRTAHGSTIPIVPFAITGYSAVLLWRNGANRCAKAIEPNLSLLYHRNVRVLDVFASRLILEIAGATMSLMALMLALMAIGSIEPPHDVIKMLVAWCLLAWFSISVGLIVGALSERSDSFERLWHTVTYLLFPLSGALFFVDWLPSDLRHIVLWIPMVHGVEMLRSGYFGDAVVTHESPGYLLSVNLVTFYIGLSMVRRIASRVEP